MPFRRGETRLFGLFRPLLSTRDEGEDPFRHALLRTAYDRETPSSRPAPPSRPKIV